MLNPYGPGFPPQSPDRSGLPSAVLGMGAARSAFPSAVRGMPGVLYFNHCADAGVETRSTAPMMAVILALALIRAPRCSLNRLRSKHADERSATCPVRGEAPAFVAPEPLALEPAAAGYRQAGTSRSPCHRTIES